MVKAASLKSSFAFLFLLIAATCNFPVGDEGIGCDLMEFIDAINAANADPDLDTIILGDACLYGLTEANTLMDVTVCKLEKTARMAGP